MRHIQSTCLLCGNELDGASNRHHVDGSLHGEVGLFLQARVLSPGPWIRCRVSRNFLGESCSSLAAPSRQAPSAHGLGALLQPGSRAIARALRTSGRGQQPRPKKKLVACACASPAGFCCLFRALAPLRLDFAICTALRFSLRALAPSVACGQKTAARFTALVPCASPCSASSR